MIEKPNYYGIMPASVRYDKELKPMEKIMYTEITALSNKNGYCNATNSYFAELYDVHKNTVGDWINKLVEKGYLQSELIYKGKQIIERRLYINDIPVNKKIEENNTRINNTRLIKRKNIKKEKSLYEGKDKIEIGSKEIEAMELINQSNYSEEAKELIIYWWFCIKPLAIKKKLKSNSSLIALLKRDYMLNSPYLSEFIEQSEERLWMDLLPTCWDSFVKNKEIENKFKNQSTHKSTDKQPKKIIKNNYDWDIGEWNHGSNKKYSKKYF